LGIFCAKAQILLQLQKKKHYNNKKQLNEKPEGEKSKHLSRCQK